MAVGPSRRLRVTLVVLCAFLAISTGVEGRLAEEQELVAGHTSYVRVVRTTGIDDTGSAPPVDYGLATLREVRLFGLIERDRPVDESAGRWVFAWSDHAPDPRTAQDLTPTGDQAQVRDRYDAYWDVFEFTYADGHYAYGVAVANVHLADPGIALPPGIDPEHGSYNYAITYRVDRLFPEDHTVDGQAIPVTAGLAEGESATKRTVRFGLGDAPGVGTVTDRSMDRYDVPAGEAPHLGPADLDDVSPTA